ncbi:hypothetical protein B566_EDAN010848 [Ephemera danica]|nr:hypothetical protein B566_EDAN010848 [Ephemera danica]
MAVVLPMNVADIFRPRGFISKISEINLRRIFALYIQHLLIDIFHGHFATEYGGHGEIATMAGVTCCHHVFRVKHLQCTAWCRCMIKLPFTCCVSSATLSALKLCEARDVRGAKPGMKKCRRGNGTMFTASLRRPLPVPPPSECANWKPVCFTENYTMNHQLAVTSFEQLLRDEERRWRRNDVIGGRLMSP